METLSGVSNWRLVIRREEDQITLLRAVTCDRQATLPESLFGLPVTVLGDHALSPNAREVQGEEAEIVCGRLSGDEVWDNRRLEELTLPPRLYRVWDYALLNCDALHTLRLHDSVCHWSGGALMNCRSLHRFFLRRVDGEQRESLAFFNDELSRELDVTILQPDGETLRLVFPEYVEVYEENCPAHHFDYNIEGAGYPYHHCFYQKKLNMRTYDNLWTAYLGMEHDADAAMRLAWWRLRYPVELSERAEKGYLDHLCRRTETAAKWLVEQRDTAGLRFLLERTEPDRTVLANACEAARTSANAEALALLLEHQHRRFPTGAAKCFDL